MNKKLVTGLLVATMVSNTLPIVTLAEESDAYIVVTNNESSDIKEEEMLNNSELLKDNLESDSENMVDQDNPMVENNASSKDNEQVDDYSQENAVQVASEANETNEANEVDFGEPYGDGVEGGNIYFDAETGTITRADTTVTKVEIPAMINGKAVTTIGIDAFLYCTNLEEIIIPDSVTTIKRDAFHDCINLKSVKLPNTITTLDAHLFIGCESLEEITIPSSVTTIEEAVFQGCTNLKEITIPDNVTTIERWAFLGCTNLKEITISDSVTTIGEDAFRDCTNLEEIILPDSVTTIGLGAFYKCTNLKSVKLPNTITTLEGYLFKGCEKLEEITIPNSVTAINEAAFNECDSLTKVIVPDSVTTIGEAAFLSCANLKEITLPKSITKIEKDAFDGCSALSTIYYNGSQEEWNQISIEDKEGSNNILVKIPITNIASGNPDDSNTPVNPPVNPDDSNTPVNPDDSNTPVNPPVNPDNTPTNPGTTEKPTEKPVAYKVEGGNIYFAPSTGTIVGADESVTKAVIPDKIDGYAVTTIGTAAFNKTNLETITLPNTVTTIKNGAFCHTNLKEVTLPNSVTTIENNTFVSCKQLTKFIIPDSVTTIGEYALYDCEQLKDVTLPKGLTELPPGLFQDCVSLEEITLPETVTKIGLHTFKFDAEFEKVPSLKTIYYDGDWDKVIKEDQDCDILDRVEIKPTNEKEVKPSETSTSSKSNVALPSNDYTRNTISITTSEGGTVKSSTKRVTKDTVVTLTVEPTIDYTLDTLTVTDAEGNVLAVANKDVNLYQFKMPNSAVEVNATFKEKALAQQAKATTFTDIASDASYKEAVQYVYDRGLMTGDGNATTFNPDGTMTRAMIVTVLYRLEGKPAIQQATFDDVSHDQWYHDAIAWAAENNIVAGYNEQTFAPKDPITLEHLVAILGRYAEFKGQDVKTEDLIDETVNLKNNATRAQVATALSRYNL